MIDTIDQVDFLIYGIPNFKLEKEIVIRRTDVLKESGIKFELNCDIGKDITFEDIKISTTQF